MSYTIAVEYALHSLYYLVGTDGDFYVVDLKSIANLHGISESYLSKIFTKLSKANIVSSQPGVKGGYKLSRQADQISFWDIIDAVEGSEYMFKCKELRQQNKFNTNADHASFQCNCLIKTVINDAEEKMRDELRSKSLQWLFNQTYPTFSRVKQEKIKEWQVKSLLVSTKKESDFIV